ncbi:cell wall-binding repeat-containing protein [Cellulosimicrobium protaetiae]|uniref:DUF1524 domain-containing protein n=1 Tax=Cellulosimicrobium protaetiae TaxID=2587808 RepID=A0A6M5UA29_9MICO|nr:cell wall-binding repeat-containing protein [Cellulosimicrobium protaetiae]QJW35326.1 DUF1524 domain-containing protein [Cellulosimicrobium protaetiae]
MRTPARVGLVAALSLVASTFVGVQPVVASTVTAADLPGLIAVAAETTSPAYDRERFEHWIDADGDGCNTRYEVLVAEAVTPPAVSGSCTLTGGSWVSVYDGFTTTSIEDLQVDHVVALAEAWRSGASAWTDEQRRAFANDLDVPYALAAVSGASNQAKSDHDPAEWQPTDVGNRCEYVTAWALVKYRWSLTVDQQEKDALTSALSGGCGAQAVTLPDTMITAVPNVPVDPGQTVIAPFADGTTRLSGSTRYETALQASKRYAAGVPAVFVATGSNFPDALSAASAAARVGGPLLLTTPGSLPAAVQNEIVRLAPKKIYVVGGRGAVSDTVLATLRGIAPTTRLGGASRYETGLGIVDATFPTSAHAIIATGRSFPDALAATGAAGARQAPVILVDGLQPRVSPATLSTLHRLGVTSVAIAGGSGAVSGGIADQLRADGIAVSRYGGASRYDTAALVNQAYFPPGSTTTMFLATGTDFPDALAGAALAGRLAAPLYVTSRACTPETIRSAVASLGASKRVVMGGAGAVSDAAAANLGCLSSSAPTIAGSVVVGSTLTARPGSWTAGTSFSYQWLANGAAISGATASTLTLTAGQHGKRISVRVTGARSGYVSASATSSATAAVVYPQRTPPVDIRNCPSWAPIKGNHSSSGEWIYHVPGGRSYADTNPEECFTTEAAAVAAGYRKSKV